MDDVQKMEIKEKVEMEYMVEKARIFSKNSCKDCHGRGYLLISLVNPDSPNTKYFRYCHCANKNMKKYQ